MLKGEKVTFGKGPLDSDTVWFAEKDTVIETDPFKVPAATAIGLGHVSDEGDTKTPGYGDPEVVYNQNGLPVKHSDGEYEPSITFNLMQAGNDFDVDKVVYGKDNVIGNEDVYYINEHAGNKSVGIVIIDHTFDNGAKERQVYSNATIKLSGDIVNNYSEVRMLPITVTPTVDENGYSCITYKKAKADEVVG